MRITMRYPIATSTSPGPALSKEYQSSVLTFAPRHPVITTVGSQNGSSSAGKASPSRIVAVSSGATKGASTVAISVRMAGPQPTSATVPATWKDATRSGNSVASA